MRSTVVVLESAGLLCIIAGLVVAVSSARLVETGLKASARVLESSRGDRHPIVSVRVNDALIIRELGGFAAHPPGTDVVVIYARDDVRQMQIDDVADIWGGSAGMFLVGISLISVAAARHHWAGRSVM